MFKFRIKKLNKLARLGEIQTPHGKVQTPAFMPCATAGSVKGISPEEISKLGFEMILSNTYHLYLKPGEKIISEFGGVQKYTNWNKPILTDSGGYQIFSLGKNYQDYSGENRGELAKVNSDGVAFKSFLDGKIHFFAPEKVLEVQKDLGSDILMVLDECTEFPATKERAKKSMDRTQMWAKKSIEYWREFGNKDQALFGIVQGSTFEDLREESTKYISALDFDGIAVGGVSVGEGKRKMYQVIHWVSKNLAKDKPHYLMGVGEPEDIIEAVKYGFDLFDCVLPTRLGRHGTVWQTNNWKKFTKIDLRKSKYLTDKKTIMKDCNCPTCKGGYSRGFISNQLRGKEMLPLRLCSIHNLWILAELMRKIRQDMLK